MKKRYVFAIFLAITFAASHSIILTAAERPLEKRDINPIIRQIVDYALPELGNYLEKKQIKKTEKGTASLGASSFSASPGVTIGNTYYDIQHLNTTGRMVGIGYNIAGSDTSTYIHFTWMDLPGPDLSSDRTAVYTYGSVGTGALGGNVTLTSSPEYAGYFNLVVTHDNRAIIS